MELDDGPRASCIGSLEREDEAIHLPPATTPTTPTTFSFIQHSSTSNRHHSTSFSSDQHSSISIATITSSPAAPTSTSAAFSDPVADGSLHIRDFSSLRFEDTDDPDLLRRRFSEWCSSVEERLQGIEVNVEGVKFRLCIAVPKADDFEWMKKSWEDHYASKLLDSRRISWRGVARRPDTIIVSGVPSRWFAEPRVSSKASMLVTHTIFQALGRIRNLNVAGDDNLGKKVDEITGEVVSGLQCKIWVQFESHEDFCDAMKVLCGRSLQKEGSNLKVDYDLTWDRDGYFQKLQQRPVKSHLQEKVDRLHVVPAHISKEAPRQHTQLKRSDHNGPRPKRFRE
ncbi:hypothetical protein J5N97_010402 [Dioscorea zingiberensis]|uniref:Uncharacterized protein n=1 Tax=Dioscorea zingiberensis TaxID=325984 RepID=A0A9D5D037_9LILI|nr:hypothetical protein J5N97_010402 [Dioscorea zingiberensis]